MFVVAPFAYIGSVFHSIRFANQIHSDRNGTEIVGITVGEMQNPRRTIPRAVKLTFWRMFVTYIASIFLIGTLVSYNDQNLLRALNSNPDASASPFVIAILNSGIRHGVVGFLNVCILIFVVSNANSNL